MYVCIYRTLDVKILIYVGLKKPIQQGKLLSQVYTPSLRQNSLKCFIPRMLPSNWMALTKPQTEVVSHKVYWRSSLQNICSQKITLSWLPEAWKRLLFLPPQGFGLEGKTRRGIIVSSTYTYKECGILVWYANQSRFEETRRARS